MSDALTVTAALIFLLAGLVKGMIGLGLPTVAMGLLGLMMPPGQAAALLVLPSLVTNVWQLVAGPHLRSLMGRLWPMMLGVCVGTWVGMTFQWLTADTAGRATIGLGIALMIYAIAGLAAVPWRVPPARERFLSPLIGIVTGLVTAATGVFVIPAVPYLQALDLEKDDLVQALGLSFTVSTVALGMGLVHGGLLDGSVSGASLLALVPALAGMWIGQRLRARVAAPAFRRWFLVGLLLLGAYLALSSLRV